MHNIKILLGISALLVLLFAHSGAATGVTVVNNSNGSVSYALGYGVTGHPKVTLGLGDYVNDGTNIYQLKAFYVDYLNPKTKQWREYYFDLKSLDIPIVTFTNKKIVIVDEKNGKGVIFLDGKEITGSFLRTRN